MTNFEVTYICVRLQAITLIDGEGKHRNGTGTLKRVTPVEKREKSMT